MEIDLDIQSFLSFNLLIPNSYVSTTYENFETLDRANYNYCPVDKSCNRDNMNFFCKPRWKQSSILDTKFRDMSVLIKLSFNLKYFSRSCDPEKHLG